MVLSFNSKKKKTLYLLENYAAIWQNLSFQSSFSKRVSKFVTGSRDMLHHHRWEICLAALTFEKWAELPRLFLYGKAKSQRKKDCQLELSTDYESMMSFTNSWYKFCCNSLIQLYILMILVPLLAMPHGDLLLSFIWSRFITY